MGKPPSLSCTRPAIRSSIASSSSSSSSSSPPSSSFPSVTTFASPLSTTSLDAPAASTSTSTSTSAPVPISALIPALGAPCISRQPSTPSAASAASNFLIRCSAVAPRRSSRAAESSWVCAATADQKRKGMRCRAKYSSQLWRCSSVSKSALFTRSKQRLVGSTSCTYLPRAGEGECRA